MKGVTLQSSGSNTMKYSLADLFAGPGGLSLGFKLSGFFRPVVAVESHQKVAETYENNFGLRVIKRKIAQVKPKEILEAGRQLGHKSIDVVVGGPPCRPFTLANTGGTRWERIKEEINKNKKLKQKIVNHPDWYDFWKMIDALKPRAVVAENVMGFRTQGDVFSRFLQRLELSGYATCFRKLDAQYFGVPQKRKRIFIVGIRDFFGDKDSLLPRNPQEGNRLTVEHATSDLPALSNDSPGSEISKYNRGRPTSYQSLMRRNSKTLYDHIAHSVHPVMAERFQYIPPGYNLRKTWVEGKIPETSMQSQYVRRKVRKGFSKKTLENMHSNIYRRLKWRDVSPTITHVRKTVLIHPLQDRLLSVREAARLQSFPDWFRFSGSLNQQYQQIADAVPPLLAKAVAVHVEELLLCTPQSSKIKDVEPNNSEQKRVFA